MKKLFLSLLFILQAALLVAEKPLSYKEAVEAHPALVELLAYFEISSETPLSDVKSSVEKLWMQKGLERWQFDARYEEDKRVLWPYLTDLHLLQPIFAVKSDYDYALVHGALLSTVEKRLDFLISEWKRGVRFNQLIFLTGRRPLLPAEIEKVHAPFETDMVKWVYEKSEMPLEMRNLPVTFVDALGQGDKRPRTEDTVHDWLSTLPAPGSCLAVSNQPYVCYQDGVAKRLFSDPFTIETIGCGVSQDPKMSLLLDTVAKWLNQMSE